MLFDEVEFPEVQRAEAEALVESYREEGQKNLPPPVTSPPEKRFRDDRGRDRRMLIPSLSLYSLAIVNRFY